MSKSLFRTTSTVSGITSISRVLGFARDMLIAHLFGASYAIDAFYVAYRIPNLMRALFAEGAFAQAFVPVLSEYRQKRSLEEVKQLIRCLQGNLTVVLCIILAIAYLFTPYLTGLFAPGYLHDPARFALTTHMLRITFPYMLFICLTAFYSSILNTYGFFSTASLTPVWLNVVMIVTALWVAPHMPVPVVAIAWGVFFAGVAQWLFQMPALRRNGFLLWPKVNWQNEGVKRVLKLLLPALFGASVAQIGVLIDTGFASFLPVGSVTWLYYSDRLCAFPLGIFGVALATVVLPSLARKHTDAAHEDYSTILDWALRCVLIIAMPAAVGLFMLAVPLFTALFQYGRFTTHDAIMSSLSLKAFAFGLPGFMMVKVLASAFYSRQNVKTPVRIAVCALMLNVTLNFILIGPLAHAGLALATTLSSSFNAILLFTVLWRKRIFQPSKGWLKYFIRLLAANGAIVILLWFLNPAPAVWFGWNWVSRLIHLFEFVLLAVACYFICLRLLGLRLRDFRAHAA
ncbi:MAG: murein biosynthesis integral membrane protein MurJ [Gammaproteobacteria bacterium]